MSPTGNVPLQLRAFLSTLSAGKKLTLFALTVFTLIGFSYLVIWSGSPDYQVLFSNLSPEDAGAILAKLKEQKIPFQVSATGTSMMVPKEKVYETRLEMASQGLPQGSGVGFEIFDSTKLGMTEFVQNVNYQRALQGEICRTINGIAEVEASRVHIVMPSKSLFVEREKPASASVVLKVRPGRWLTKDQVQGIVHLVSASVAGLRPEDVTVVDNSGKMLAGMREGSSAEQASAEYVELQDKMEKTLEERVKTMLEKALGPDKAIVRVACRLSCKTLEQNEERYDPENKVVRSEQLLNESSMNSEPVAAGIPGVASNTGEPQSTNSSSNSSAGFKKEDRTVNYEIGKVISHTIEPIRKVERLSVAVMVDGIYKLVKEEGKKKAKEELKYFPRSQEEMEKLENLVKSAVSFDGARGDLVEVVNIPFEATKAAAEGEEFKEDWRSTLKQYRPVLKYAFLGIFLVLTFLFVVRPVVQWLTTASASADLEVLRQLPKTVGEIEREYRGGGIKGPQFRERALEMISKDNDHSVQLIRDWMKEK
jgi:flagellar M-ring protein FliF